MSNSERVRLDKWLWAARFYKTRAIAKAAIEGGKVHYDGQRVKPGKIVANQATLTIRLGHDLKEVIIQSVNDKRTAASIAQTMYQETEQSIEQREKDRLLRQAAGVISQKKPDKKQRRQIHRFQRRSQDSS